MRKLSLLAGLGVMVALILAAAAPAHAEAADSHMLTLTGCLNATDDGGFFLEKISEAPEGFTADKVWLKAAEGVDLAPHAGHEVQVTGEKKMKKKDDGDEKHGEEHGEEMEHDEHGEKDEDKEHDKKKAYLKVTELTHIAAECG